MSEFKQLNNEEISTFFSQTGLLFQAGISPFECMAILLKDCDTEEGQDLYKEIMKEIRSGNNFSEALASTGVFPDYVINMVSLGEDSGNLDDCMLALADYYEKEQSIAESLRSALTYPLIMIFMMMVVIVVLIVKVMPIFQQVFVELGSEMSGFAATLLNVGNTLSRYSLVLLTILVLLVVLFFIARYTKPGKAITHSFLSRFPLTKGFYESIACERFASSLAIAMSSGMDTFSGLDMAKQLVENKDMELKIEKCKTLIRSGKNFAEGLTESEIFKNIHAQMISVGAKSGNIDIVLARIADSYEKETTKRISSILEILEPTLVIVLSVIVGMILLSVILPLMGIMSSIG